MDYRKFFINKLSNESRDYMYEKGYFTEQVKYDDGLDFIYEVRKLIGRENQSYFDEIGTHPDFIHLETDDRHEYGHLCSVSIDIRNSTRMNLKYNQTVVKDIKQSIIKTIIDIYTAFDGHIHRLQGDGVVVFFRNKLKISQCIIDAINASVFLLRFREDTLSKVLEQFGLENIKLRIGIDFGDDNTILWSKYGTRNVTEVTATGVNIDLAFKIQQKVPSNSIGIGENIVKYLDMRKEMLNVDSHIESGRKVDDVYIMMNPHYKYYILKWKKYINEVFTLLNDNNKIMISVKSREQVPEGEMNNNTWSKVMSGCDSLEKNLDLYFEVVYTGDEIATKYKWGVQNYGEEASSSGESLNFIMEEYVEDYCEQRTKYTSLHYMCCTAFNSVGRTLSSKKFGVYINDEDREIRDLRKEYNNE